MQEYVDEIHGQNLQSGHEYHAWLCLELLDVLCQLAERGHASSVRSILEFPLKHCPEILLLGIANVNVQFTGFFLLACPIFIFHIFKLLVLSLYFLLQTTYNLLQHEVALIVFPIMLKNVVGSGMILHLWHVNPNLVLHGIIYSQNNDLDSSVRIVEVCEELKVSIWSSMDVSYYCFDRWESILISEIY